MKCMANGSIPATYSRYEYVSDKPKSAGNQEPAET